MNADNSQAVKLSGAPKIHEFESYLWLSLVEQPGQSKTKRSDLRFFTRNRSM